MHHTCIPVLAITCIISSIPTQVFLGMSIAGTIFQGYFYAFHLLNIVNNNQLLKGVIQAVTQNGKFRILVKMQLQ